MPHQFLLALWFYILFSLFAGPGLLLTLRLFPGSAGMAYFLAKPLGLAAFGYVIWFFASLKILDYQQTWLIVVLFGLVSLAGFIYAFRFFQVRESSGKRKKLLKNIILLEVVSLGLFFAYLYLRSFNAAAFGTERFMDMGLLNASLKAQSFPFIDSWYAGHAVNYYYYGHYLIGLLTKLSGVSSFFTYNFALGLLYTVSFMLSALLVYEATKSKFFAGLAGFSVTTAGSLFYSSCVISSWLHNQAICSYASSTRLYTPSYIINEIPSYSFTVGDLHAHFLALPFFLVNLILIYCFSRTEKISKILSLALLIGLVASALINPSDVTSLALLLGLVWLYKFYLLHKNIGGLLRLIKTPQAKALIWLAIFLGFGGIILSLPFLLNFRSPVLGFGLAPVFAAQHKFWFNGYQYPTPFLAFLGMWGVYVVAILTIIYFLKKQLGELSFAALVFLSAIILIAFVEIFYVKDIYHIANPPYFRANTVFKYGYHTWILLSVAFCTAFSVAFSKLALHRQYKKLRGVLGWLLAVFIFFSLYYPYQAIKQFYLTNTSAQTLDASAFMKDQSTEDLDTVNYIKQNIKNRSVVLEAVGDSYTYFARMSVFTGNVTAMGWKTHEWTWRLEGAEAEKIKATDPSANVETGYGAIAKVAQDVETIYQTANLTEATKLLAAHGVQYVYIGNLERTTYPTLQEEKFYQLGHVVFQSGNSKLFELN